MIPTGQPQPAQPPATYETKYTYHYDAYGNWIEQNTVARSGTDVEWSPGLRPSPEINLLLIYAITSINLDTASWQARYGETIATPGAVFESIPVNTWNNALAER